MLCKAPCSVYESFTVVAKNDVWRGYLFLMTIFYIKKSIWW